MSLLVDIVLSSSEQFRAVPSSSEQLMDLAVVTLWSGYTTQRVQTDPCEDSGQLRECQMSTGLLRLCRWVWQVVVRTVYILPCMLNRIFLD